MADAIAMLSFQRLEVYQRSIECAAILDVMRRVGTLKPHGYDWGVDLLTSVVAMLTKMIQR